MNTIDTNKTAASPVADNKPQTNAKASDNTQVKIVTLDQLAREMKVSPRDARMLLRLAAKQKRLYPTLGTEHVARQPWQWELGSKSLEEAKKALAQTDG